MDLKKKEIVSFVIQVAMKRHSLDAIETRIRSRAQKRKRH